MVRACTPKWRFACLREAASAKAGHAGVGALRAWAISVAFGDGGNPSPSGEVPLAIGCKTLSLLPP